MGRAAAAPSVADIPSAEWWRRLASVADALDANQEGLPGLRMLKTRLARLSCWRKQAVPPSSFVSTVGSLQTAATRGDHRRCDCDSTSPGLHQPSSRASRCVRREELPARVLTFLRLAEIAADACRGRTSPSATLEIFQPRSARLAPLPVVWRPA